jgi:hypothetical protein
MMAIEPVLPAGFDADAATAMDNVSCTQWSNAAAVARDASDSPRE